MVVVLIIAVCWYCWTFKRPTIVTSLATTKLPLRDTSPAAKMRPPKLASDPTNKRAFAETSDAATNTFENVFTPPMVCVLVVSTELPFTPAIAVGEMEPTGKLTVPATTRPFFTYTFPLRDASPRTNKREFAVRSPCARIVEDAVNAVTEVAPETVRPLDTVALPLIVAFPLTEASACAVS